ncbi:MAG: ribosome biogenesis GTP-binding protein YihA/YsxC [Pseudomonadota bacterium]
MPNTLYFNARFETSASKLAQCPQDSVVEVAFAGRSNAGKSSAINTICRQRQLARTSKTPGRTQLINYFALGEDRFLVDLPGYGYAKVPMAVQRAWQKNLEYYLQNREQLQCLIIVMDIRRPLTEFDWQLIEWCQASGVALHCLLTKSDKLSRNQAMKTLFNAQKSLEVNGVEATLQLFSALKQTGVDDAHELLDQFFVAS